VNWIAADILRIKDGVLVEHWDVHSGRSDEGAVQKWKPNVWRLISSICVNFHQEVGSRRITANKVQPGPIDTELNPATGALESIRQLTFAVKVSLMLP